MVFAVAFIFWDLLFTAWIIGEFSALVVRNETATELLRDTLEALSRFCVRYYS